MPNKLSQFWQEFKRRNVTRVLAVYIAAAFMILELVDMTTEPFGLPEWSMKVAFFILLAGLIVAVVVSWIYDIHPERGMVKTVPAEKVKTEHIQESSNSWKIASYISFVVIVVLIILNVIPRSNSKRAFEKSIAVLPLEYLSEDPNKEYLANGVLDAITGHLSLIEGLRVMPRTSVEQYRENRKSAKEIGEELDVSYLIEGSFLMIEDQVKLTIQLVLAEEGDHLFFNEYDRDYKDIIVVQSEVAQTIAKEIKVILTPEEKQRIERIPTTSLTAYDFYQRGKQEYFKSGANYQNLPTRFLTDVDKKEAFELAENYFNEALSYDSTFAQAYTGLALIYWGNEGYFSDNYLDTVRVLLDKALLFDPGLAEAHTLKGRYFRELNDKERAMREVDKAIALNPNDWEAYNLKANISSGFINRISNLHKAVILNRGPELPGLLRSLRGSYQQIGFFDKAVEITEEVLKLTGDSIGYLSQMASVEHSKGNINRSFELLKQCLALDSTQLMALTFLFQSYLFYGDKEQALKYGKIWVEMLNTAGGLSVNNMHRIGAYYSLQGLEEEADYYYNLQIEYCLREIELGREADRNTYYDLAGAYAVKGETEKALENLKIWRIKALEKSMTMLWYLGMDSNFNSVRDNPEFQQILRQYELEYQAEHDRVRKWLEENDML